VTVPFNLGSFKWKPDEAERKAAWCLYIELVTRIATQELAEYEGLDRDVLRSLYALFSSTRKVLLHAGPGVGVAKGSLGGIAIAVLNVGLRPFMSRWRGRMSAWEQTARPGDEWQEHQAFRAAL